MNANGAVKKMLAYISDRAGEGDERAVDLLNSLDQHRFFPRFVTGEGESDANPISLGYFFWNETWSVASPVYHDYDEAVEGLRRYGKELDGDA